MPIHTPCYSATERLLCLSNGHGEDVIAVRILQALQQSGQCPKLFALPLVGQGAAYQSIGVPIIGPVKTMPSGGFIYMDGRQLARDVQGGLLQLTWTQFRAMRQWAQQGGSILAVGDIFPLLLAYFSGAPYAFVGTAKSEYYLRDRAGVLFPQTRLDAWSGSVYYPWERWLMGQPRCRAVFPRDALTTKILQQWAIPAFDLGNPMMDGLEPTIARTQLSPAVPVVSNPVSQSNGHETTLTEAYPLWRSRPVSLTHDTSTVQAVPNPVVDAHSSSHPSDSADLRIVLLPGSRTPEAYENWGLMLQAVAGVLEHFPQAAITFVGAISPNLSLEPLSRTLTEQGWLPSSTVPTHSVPPSLRSASFADAPVLWFSQRQANLGLCQHAYADCLQFADWAIAMAGTATEQFVGLGKPAITLAGKGPQFTPKFAEAQTRLLGESVTLVDSPEQVAIALQTLLRSPETRQYIAANGLMRMGTPGAAQRIAERLLRELAHP